MEVEVGAHEPRLRPIGRRVQILEDGPHVYEVFELDGRLVPEDVSLEDPHAAATKALEALGQKVNGIRGDPDALREVLVGKDPSELTALQDLDPEALPRRRRMELFHEEWPDDSYWFWVLI